MKSERTIATLLLALGLLAAASGRADYLAYAADEGSSPLPESIDAIDARFLVELHWRYRGGRSPITLWPVVDATGTRSSATRTSTSANGIPLAAIQAVVVETLHQTGRFDVTVAAPGNAGPERVPSEGHTLEVSLTRYESGIAKQIANPRAVRSHRPQVEQGRVAFRIRLVGPVGELVVADQLEAVVDEPQPDFASKLTVARKSPDLWRTAIGQATLVAVNKGVYEIVKSVGPLPVKGRVVKAEDNRLWVNFGAGIVSVGDELEVITRGEPLVDPETGLDLGGVETTLATLRVVQVAERFSIAEILSASGTPSRGDHVRSSTTSQEFQFAPVWNPARQ